MQDDQPSPFADLISGSVWLAIASGIMIGSWRMDRLEHLQASVYTVPGLVPGILGAAIGIMGTILILRSLRAGGLSQALIPEFHLRDHWRILTSLFLCLVFAGGAVGSGVPFWLAAAMFIAIFVFVFQHEDRKRAGTVLRGGLFAALFGVVVGVAIHYVFQELFLVRLP